jgi:hypothetical protein
VSDGLQVGYVDGRASLWSGTAASWVDLHTYLPSGFTLSRAEAIWSDGNVIYVVGYAFSPAAFGDEAFLWTSAVPEPSSLCVLGLLALFSILRRGSRQNR